MKNKGWQLSSIAKSRLKKRYRKEKRLRAYGQLAIFIALGVLVVLLVSVFIRGHSAFTKTEIALNLTLDPSLIEIGDKNDNTEIRKGEYGKIIRQALFEVFPEVETRSDRRKLIKLLSKNSRYEVAKFVSKNPQFIGTTQKIWLSASSDVDILIKGKSPRNVPQSERRLNDKQLSWIDKVVEMENLRTSFNWDFLSGSDSREPEIAGIGGALAGSFWTLIITLILAFPIGVSAAIYMQEFAPKNRLTDFIEVNINNLAAVPSIVFGLLGLAIFIQLLGLPRSTAIVGGFTLMLMTLPTIIIATRAALSAVPPSIREAAHGVGASRVQVVSHHVLPMALPGILTGTIIGMARALGETAPLLMIGMVAFIVDIPSSPADPATALPVQIFLWADSPERGFVEKMSAAIIVLLLFLVVMNALAVYLRRKFEIRW